VTEFRCSSGVTLSWSIFRRQDYVLAQLEGYDKKGLVRRVSYRDIAAVQGIPTARDIEVFDARRNSRTVLKLDKLEYNAPLSESDFTLQALRRG
jgi:hypothetical protein